MTRAHLTMGVVIGFIACASISPRAQKQRPETNPQRDSAPPVVTPAAPQQQALPHQQADHPNNQTQNSDELFWPPSWSNWALVVAAIWAGRIALKTLSTIQEQTTISRQSLRLLNRGYLDVVDWKLLGETVVGGRVQTLYVRFAIKTATTPVRLEHLEVSEPATANPSQRLHAVIGRAARFPYTLTLGPLSLEQQEQLIRDGGLSIPILGRIEYTDVFRQTRHRRFARIFIYTPNKPVHHTFQVPEGPDLNTEEEWGEE
jgi:hypothetical protein